MRLLVASFRFYRFGTMKIELLSYRISLMLMDKEDARFQTLERLHERRKQVVRLHRKKMGVMRIVDGTKMVSVLHFVRYHQYRFLLLMVSISISLNSRDSGGSAKR